MYRSGGVTCTKKTYKRQRKTYGHAHVGEYVARRMKGDNQNVPQVRIGRPRIERNDCVDPRPRRVFPVQPIWRFASEKSRLSRHLCKGGKSLESCSHAHVCGTRQTPFRIAGEDSSASGDAHFIKGVDITLQSARRAPVRQLEPHARL